MFPILIIFGWRNNFINYESNLLTENLYRRHVAPTYGDSLDDLMNGPIRDYLQIIPENVTWGGMDLGFFLVLLFKN